MSVSWRSPMMKSVVRKIRSLVFHQMNRTIVQVTAVARRIATAALCLSFASVAAAAQPPLLRVETDGPLAITGSGFRPQDSVEVSIVMGPRRLEAAAIASDVGEFTVRFAGTRLERCATPLVISAIGKETGRVTANLPPRECAAP